MESNILEGLNPAQRAAVEHYDTPSLIIAGAGSGKTRVLTSRIAYMIERGVDPRSILALTFTNKAAEQMRERIAQMVPDGRSRFIRMGTFHSVFARILRENAGRLGYPETYTIYEPSDSRNLLKSIVRELRLDEEKYKPAKLAARISFAKNGLVTPQAYAAHAAHAAEDRAAQIPEFGRIYGLYCERCKRNGAMDFDDLLLQTNILLRDCDDVLARYQERFRYILVDEYQDTNYAQYVIVRRLSAAGARVCVVGDDAQSIYSFRGAKIENILSFRNDYPDAEVFKLEQNYRSTRTIVEAANSVIVHNARRMEKRCFSEGPAGDPIRILKAYTDRDEAEQVVADLRDRVRAGGDAWSDAVILYRTNSQSLVFEENLRRRGIPYRIYKGSSFYDHKEIKDLLAYIRLVINPHDDEAFRRIVNWPARGIGDTTVQRIGDLARAAGCSMWEAVDRLVAEPTTDPVQRAIVRKTTEFVGMIRALSQARAGMGLYEFGLEVATRSGMLAALRAERTPEAESALGNIEELLNSMQEFRERCDAAIRNGERPAEAVASVEEWMQEMMLLSDMDRDDDPRERDRVTLMTVHSAKGLEYKYVYVAGMEENLFPSPRAAESPEGLEEERRLFYVALTRAKTAATLSYAEMRFRWGNMEFTRPSGFLREIDPRYLETPLDEGDRVPRSAAPQPGGSAIDELRRRYDYRYRSGGAPSAGRAGERVAAGTYGAPRRPTVPARSSDRPVARQAPDPALVRSPRVSTEGMRSLGVRPCAADAAPAPARPASVSAAPGGGGSVVVGQRVEHALFGAGTVLRVEELSTDRKLVVRFDSGEEKTLLARFAKLKQL